MLGRGHQGRALSNEHVGAGGARIERQAGNSEDLAPLLHRKTRRDQRSRAACRLDHHHPTRKPRDDAVAPRKVAPARLAGDRHFGERGPALDEPLERRPVLARIDALMPSGDTATVPVAGVA